MWHSERLIKWALSIGSKTGAFIIALLQDNARHLYQKERSALGILRLSDAYNEQQLEHACEQALKMGTFRYASLASLLKKSDQVSTTQIEDTAYQSQAHENLRGAKYYH